MIIGEGQAFKDLSTSIQQLSPSKNSYTCTMLIRIRLSPDENEKGQEMFTAAESITRFKPIRVRQIPLDRLG